MQSSLNAGVAVIDNNREICGEKGFVEWVGDKGEQDIKSGCSHFMSAMEGGEACTK